MPRKLGLSESESDLKVKLNLTKDKNKKKHLNFLYFFKRGITIHYLECDNYYDNEC